MTKPNSDELSALRSAQISTFNDTCTIYRVAYVTGTYSDDENQTVTGTFNVDCGVMFPSSNQLQREARKGQLLLVEHDLVIRLPVDFQVDRNDYFADVVKAGVGVSGTFQIVSEPIMLSTVQKLQLARVAV